MKNSPITEAELMRLRAETPGTQHVCHFNNAGAALLAQPVLDAVASYQLHEAKYGGYEAAAAYTEALADTRIQLAQLLGASQAEEIAVVESATMAWNKAFHGFDWQTGDVVLTAEAAYGSNYLAFLHAHQQRGIEIRVAPSDGEGQVDLAAMEKLIDDRVKLICLTHIPTHGGLVNPAAEVGALARAHGIPYLLDACQTAGQLPINVEDLHCDMLAATGRKFLRAPRGTGFLYVRRDFQERLKPPFTDLWGAEWLSENQFRYHADARRFESFESHRAGQLGLGVAAQYALELGVDRSWHRIQALASSLRKQLAGLPGVKVQDRGKLLCGIVSFSMEGKHPEAIKAYLSQRHINISFAFKQGAWLDFDKRGIDALCRASLHYYNTESEIDQLVNTLRELTP